MGDWFPRQSSHQSGRLRWRDKGFRTTTGVVRKTVAASGRGGRNGSRSCYDLGSMNGVRGAGYPYVNKQRNSSGILSDSSCGSGSKVEENLLAFDFKENRQKGASRNKTKILVGSEILREMERRRSSPGVIAKLMGLDVLPSPTKVVDGQQTETGSYFRRTSSAEFKEKFVSDYKHSLQKSTRNHQEFRDVFEVMELSEVAKDRSLQSGKELHSLRRSGSHVPFLPKKIVGDNCVSSDEKNRGFKELNDDLDISDSNKDHYMKIDEASNPSLRKQLHDMRRSPSPRLSHITILESSNGIFESNEGCSTSEKNMGTCMQTDVRRPPSSLFLHSIREHRGSLSHNLSESQHSGKRDTSDPHNRIVVLKPSLEKDQNLGKTFTSLRNSENLKILYRRDEGQRQSESPELRTEGSGWQNSISIVGVKGANTKGSREIAKDLTKQMGHSIKSGNKEVPSFGPNKCVKDGNSTLSFGMDDLYNSATSWRSSNYFSNQKDSYRSSEAYSSKSSVRWDAKECLSEQWKMNCQFDVEYDSRGTRTLEELALPDSEKPKKPLDSHHKTTRNKLARAEVSTTWGCPSGISNKDGKEDGWFINLPRSISPSVPSAVYGQDLCTKHTFYGNNNFCVRQDVMNLSPTNSFHGKFNLRGPSLKRNLNCIGDNFQPHFLWDESKLHQEDKFKLLGSSYDDARTDSGHDHVDFKMLFPAHEEPVQQDTVALSGNNRKVTSFVQHQEDSFSSLSDQTDPVSLLDSKEVEQPSPVSVLEPPSEEDASSSGCVNRLIADLQELQKQLDLLQSAEDLTSDEDAGENETLQLVANILEAFRDEDDRDFSYLLDILIYSGVHGANQGRLYTACHSRDCPADPNVFEKLERKYEKLTTWSRSDRKLLFDLMNSVLSDIFAPCMDLHPWVTYNGKIGPMWGPEGLVERAWQMLVRQREEFKIGNPEEKVFHVKWLDLGDGINRLGREIERMLKDDLLDEVVSEFLLE
ncbi:uncharacterized protein [Typha latifolia]|uniref:uncharacterized protein isoform X1 n=1 Tax=Typha latifolia TaxID=4733 RepID=UPI003C2BDD11